MQSLEYKLEQFGKWLNIDNGMVRGYVPKNIYDSISNELSLSKSADICDRKLKKL